MHSGHRQGRLCHRINDMKSRTTLVLVLVALVIGGVVALDYFKGTPTEQAEAKRKRIFDFDSKDVASLKIELTTYYALTLVE